VIVVLTPNEQLSAISWWGHTYSAA